MGEIKSTLDLVMEKTRHLTLSEEEKRQQKQKELRNRLAGLLQRYRDGKLDAQKMGEELDELLQSGEGPDESNVRDEIMGRIELGSDNGPWLSLLQTRYRIDPSGLQSVEEDYRQAVKVASARRKEDLKKQLQQYRRISGSAVVPNVDADQAWSKEKRSIAANYHHQLAAKLDELKKGMQQS